MINALLGLISGLVAFLVANLPQSPIASLVLGGDGLAGSGIPIARILGWVNWVVPIKPCMTLFSAWVAACVIIALVKWLLDRYLQQVPTVGNARLI